MKKYELTNETKLFLGRTLYRIRALRDFSNIRKGDLGGFVEKDSNLSHYGNAKVYGNTVLREFDEIANKDNYFNIIGYEYNITVTPTSVHIGCRDYYPGELDSIYDDEEYENKEDIEEIKLIIDLATEKILRRL